MESRKLEILVMRHAQSEYNKMQADHAKEHNLPPGHELTELRWIDRTDLIDAVLSAGGHEQCVAAAATIREQFKHIKYVFVSPMRRTVQTAVISLKDYPGIVSWKVLPWLREILHGQNDLGLHSCEHLKNYPFIDAAELQDNPLWFLDYYDESRDVSGHAKKMKDLYLSSPSAKTLIEYLKGQFPNIESHGQMEHRVTKIKETVRSFVEPQRSQGVEVRDGEIILIAHSRLIRHMYGCFDENGQVVPARDLKFKNSEVRPFDLDL